MQISRQLRQAKLVVQFVAFVGAYRDPGDLNRGLLSSSLPC